MIPSKASSNKKIPNNVNIKYPTTLTNSFINDPVRRRNIQLSITRSQSQPMHPLTKLVVILTIFIWVVMVWYELPLLSHSGKERTSKANYDVRTTMFKIREGPNGKIEKAVLFVNEGDSANKQLDTDWENNLVGFTDFVISSSGSHESSLHGNDNQIAPSPGIKGATVEIFNSLEPVEGNKQQDMGKGVLKHENVKFAVLPEPNDKHDEEGKKISSTDEASEDEEDIEKKVEFKETLSGSMHPRWNKVPKKAKRVIKST